jgi:trehalose-6-phosphatase
MSTQVFRSLPTALEILNSVCESDVIGFHTFDYCRHFLHAIRRMLGHRFHSLPGGLLAVTIRKREFIISMSHVSIEPSVLTEVVRDAETAKLIHALKAKYAGKKVFVGVDTCERLSGLLLKLESYRMFLEDVEDPSKYVLVMYALRPNARPNDEEYTSRDLRTMSNEMNVKYRHPVVEYIETTSMTLQQRVALWTAGDVYLLTSIREGLNLMPLEYIYCRKDLADPGVVVASEFSTCSSLLNGSMKINPFNFRNVADTLHKAIGVSIKEKEARRQRDLTFVQTHTAAQWTNQILNDLSTKESLVKGNAVGPFNTKTAPHHGAVDRFQETILLDDSKAVEAYENALQTRGLKAAGSRVFVFDYGGTLVAHERVDVYMKQTVYSLSGLQPTPRMMEALKKLSEDENNSILINSTLSRKKLGNIFDDLSNITIATSGGLVTSWGANVLTVDEIEEDEQDSPSCFGSVSSVEDNENSEGEGEEEEGEGEGGEGVNNEIFHTRDGFRDTAPRSPSSTSFNTPAMDEETSRDIPVQADSPFGSPSTQVKVLAQKESFAWTKKHHESFMTDRKWDHMQLAIDWDAVKSIAVPIMAKFTTRTNGTYLTPRVPGIGWNYFGADPEWGEKQAAQLKVELESALVNYDIRIAMLPGSLDLVPRTIDKVC